MGGGVSTALAKPTIAPTPGAVTRVVVSASSPAALPQTPADGGSMWGTLPAYHYHHPGDSGMGIDAGGIITCAGERWGGGGG